MVTILVSNNGDDVRYTTAENTSIYNSFDALKKAWVKEWGSDCGSFNKWMWYMRKHNYILVDKGV